VGVKMEVNTKLDQLQEQLMHLDDQCLQVTMAIADCDEHGWEDLAARFRNNGRELTRQIKEIEELRQVLMKQRRREKRVHLMMHPPGSRLLAIADFLYSQKTYRLTFEPIIVDMRDEYFAALNKRRIWKARWMYGLYVWKFFCAMGLNWGFSLLEKILKTWRASS
jgi:hypothetical protein